MANNELDLMSYATFAREKAQEIGDIPKSMEDVADKYAERTELIDEMIGQFGAEQKGRLEEGKEQATAESQKSLQQRGLRTAVGDVQSGIEADYKRDIRGIGDTTRRQRMDYLKALSGQELQARAAVPESRLKVTDAQFGMMARPYELQQGIVRSLSSRTPGVLSKSPSTLVEDFGTTSERSLQRSQQAYQPTSTRRTSRSVQQSPGYYGMSGTDVLSSILSTPQYGI